MLQMIFKLPLLNLFLCCLGNCPFRIYMPSKPNAYGIKIWVLSDVNTKHTWNLQVYVGKTGVVPERNQGKSCS